MSPIYREERVGDLRVGPVPGGSIASSLLVRFAIPSRPSESDDPDADRTADLDRKELEDLRELIDEALQ